MREQFSSGGGREGNSVLKKFVSKTLDLQLKKFWPLPKVAQNPIDDLGTVNIAEVFSKYIFWSFRHAGWRSLANWEKSLRDFVTATSAVTLPELLFRSG